MSERPGEKLRLADGGSNEPALRDRRGTYIAVVLLEVVVVGALWALGRYFTG